jgi:hypothetical protein
MAQLLAMQPREFAGASALWAGDAAGAEAARLRPVACAYSRKPAGRARRRSGANACQDDPTLQRTLKRPDARLSEEVSIPAEWIAFLTAATTALDIFKGIKSELPKGPVADRAATEIAKAEEALKASEAELARALGYRLCRCEFPPRLCAGRKKSVRTSAQSAAIAGRWRKCPNRPGHLTPVVVKTIAHLMRSSRIALLQTIAPPTRLSKPAALTRNGLLRDL